ncbi:MAG: AAA family ATPase, partial [Bifidobacterium sp.]|nr:AAA family ATPase [Bifidobacterium sp.]
DLKDWAHSVLRHRILLTFEAQADGVSSDDIIDQIVDTVPVP